MGYIRPIATRRSQSGITLVLISLIMLILIGMGAFSMDLNHQVLNKARLQNAVDSAALAAAVVADDTSDVDLAEAAAISALNSFAAASGNQELVYTSEDISVTFSNDKQSFVDADSFSFSSGDDDIYVRVAVSDVSLTQYLSYVFGGKKNVSASAVAGPSSAIQYSCNITPMAVCGDATATDEQVWGYNPSGYDPEISKDPSTINALKVGDQSSTDMGPGNFQLLDFGQDTTGGGAALVKDALTGNYNACATIGTTVQTKPGGSVGAVAQGLNPRLNVYKGSIKNDGTVLPDIYVKQANISKDAVTGDITGSDFYYKDYNDCKTGGCGVASDYPSNGTVERRILRVPIVDCTDSGSGKTDFDVLGFGCFFLMKEVAGDSGTGSDDNVYGQFLYDCPINNGSTSVEPSDSGFYRIQLYKDPLSGVS
ncbi:pilus assembly protein TadG-related protein [Vibrio natriegens]|uniref:pilus assembly protein TadG-related protein n=1 Tax=Vibrio natriegens TaxID=691 RepID=UPI0021E88587|nr:pilus assembly protein TadG-related protein [Vibrio natriegens]UYI46495.1 pilus assembly protein TadG-related protein [Vibrio natriegens]